MIKNSRCGFNNMDLDEMHFRASSDPAFDRCKIVCYEIGLPRARIAFSRVLDTL
jgi:hypothetical protein